MEMGLNVAYIASFPQLEAGDLVIHLGDVNHQALNLPSFIKYA